MVLLFGCIYGSKVIIVEGDTDVEGGIGVGVQEIGKRGGGTDEEGG